MKFCPRLQSIHQHIQLVLHPRNRRKGLRTGEKHWFSVTWSRTAEIGHRRSAEGSIPTRSSSRIAAGAKAESDQTSHISLPDSWDDGGEQKKRKRTEKTSWKAAHDGSSDLESLKPRKVLSADSSRNLIAHLDILEKFLGESIPGGHIKAGVMQFVSPNHEPKFSKYTGVIISKEAQICLVSDCYE